MQRNRNLKDPDPLTYVPFESSYCGNKTSKVERVLWFFLML